MNYNKRGLVIACDKLLCYLNHLCTVDFRKRTRHDRVVSRARFLYVINKDNSYINNNGSVMVHERATLSHSGEHNFFFKFHIIARQANH